MCKELLVIAFVLILSSCTQEKSRAILNIDNSPKENVRFTIVFEDVIPESLPDSVKVGLISDFVTQIDVDSTLEKHKTVDSIGVPVVGFFRDSILMKIVKGYERSPNFHAHAPFLNYNYTAFYFVLDSLVYSKHECQSSQQTGSCSPVHLGIDSYYYKSELISQTVEDQIGSYWSCGCGFPPSFYRRMIDEDFKEKDFNYTGIEGLKQLIMSEVREE